MPPMRLLISQAKQYVLVMLMCGLVLTWTNVGYIETTILDTTPQEDVHTQTTDSLWLNLSRELKLDHQEQSVQVRHEIRRILADHDELMRILKAAGPYLYYIYEQTRLRGLPAELALIPIIESEFNPNDHSNKGALGLWQLMPATAHRLGVKIKSGYDGRRNVLASTKAALAYFRDLGNLFNGNWYLAIAAYNCGEARIASAIKRTGSHSFWNLPVPKETKYYVPKLLAIAEILKNPTKYGITLPPIHNKPYFTEVKVTEAVSLDKMAKSSGMNLSELRTLNPDYHHNIPKQMGEYSVLVPIRYQKTPAAGAPLADNMIKTAGMTKQSQNRINQQRFPQAWQGMLRRKRMDVAI